MMLTKVIPVVPSLKPRISPGNGEGKETEEEEAVYEREVCGVMSMVARERGLRC